MRDQEPEKEGEYLEMEVTKVLEVAEAAVGAEVAASNTSIVEGVDVSGPIAPAPASFEWTDWD